MSFQPVVLDSVDPAPLLMTRQVQMIQSIINRLRVQGPVDLGRMILSIYRAPMAEFPWQDAVNHLAAHTDSSAVIVIRPPSEDDLGFLVSCPESTEVEYAYQAHYWKTDPFRELPIGEVLTIDEFVGMDNWLQSEFYQELIGDEARVHHGLGVNLLSRNGTTLRIRLYRFSNQPPFGNTEKQAIRTLVPHFEQALWMGSSIENNQGNSEVYESVLDQLHVGVIVLDENRRMLRCNQTAKNLLKEGSSLRIRSHGLEIGNRLDNSMLQKTLATHTTGLTTMSISRAPGQRKLGLMIRGVSLPEASEGRGCPAWMMFISDPDTQIAAPLGILRQLFGFTPAEATLALKLANGHSLDEAAELLNIRRNTARAHLRSVFAKSGVTRQAELVRVILNSVIDLSGIPEAWRAREVTPEEGRA